jgi:hypothetical protein
VELSSDEDVGLKPNALIDQRKTSADDDIGDEEVSSPEPNAPNLISSGLPKQSDHSATVQVSTDVPPSGDQVMTQVELPQYRAPHTVHWI